MNRERIVTAQVVVSAETAKKLESHLAEVRELVTETVRDVVTESMALYFLYGLTAEQAVTAAMCLEMGGREA